MWLVLRQCGRRAEEALAGRFCTRGPFQVLNLRVVEGLAVATVLCARLSGQVGAMRPSSLSAGSTSLERARGDRHSGARSWAKASVQSALRRTLLWDRGCSVPTAASGVLRSACVHAERRGRGAGPNDTYLDGSAPSRGTRPGVAFPASVPGRSRNTAVAVRRARLSGRPLGWMSRRLGAL